MSFVFKINQELGTILATEIELLSISRTITTLITNQEFLRRYKGIVAEINKSYTVITDTFSPFCQLEGEEKFRSLFDEKHATFKGSYLMDVSKPRRYCENVYDAYIQMQKSKEAKIGYPLLKTTFVRLDAFYDKWITNDAFMAMSIDGVLKKLNLLLNEIAELKAKDEEDAYVVFSSVIEDFRDLLTLIQTNNEKLSQLTGA